MAKATKEKKGIKKKDDDVEPLSNFQEPKTGRVDPGTKKDKKKTAKAIKPLIIIDKVKIEDQNFLTVSYSKIESDGSTSNHSGVTFEGRWMHPDTRVVFLDLRIHLALICEFISSQQLKSIDSYKEELVDKFTVITVSIRQEEGVTLSGYKRLKRGAFNFNSLFTRFSDDEETAYRYSKELKALVEKLQEETVKYLDGTKVGENPQGSLDFPAVDSDTDFSEEDL